ESGLVVAPTRAVRGDTDAMPEPFEHEPGRGVEPAVEVHRGDQRLERIGEDRLLCAPATGVLALPEQDARAESDLARDLRERTRVHDPGPHLGELPFGQVREASEHVVGDDDAEDRVAEELEALVRLVTTVLRAPRTVRQRSPQQRPVAEAVRDAHLESVE